MDASVVQALLQQAAAAEARLSQIEGKIKGRAHGRRRPPAAPSPCAHADGVWLCVLQLVAACQQQRCQTCTS